MSRNVIGSQQRRITNVVADNTGDIIKAVSSFGQEQVMQVHNAEQETKIFDNMAKSKTEINDITNAYKVDSEGDPVAGYKEYQENVNDVFKQYGEGFKGKYANQWNNQVKSFNFSNSQSIKNWGVKQTQKNTLSNMESAIENNLLSAKQDGQKYGAGELDMNAVQNFLSSEQSIKRIGDGILGEVTTNKALEDYKSKYSASYVSGVAEIDPEKAKDLLVDDRFSATIDYSDRKLLNKIISKQEKIQQQEKVNNYKTNAESLLSENPYRFREYVNEVNRNSLSFKEEMGYSWESMSKVDAFNKKLVSKHNDIILGDFYANPTKAGLEDVVKYTNLSDKKISKLTELYEETPNYEMTTTYKGYERALSNINKLSLMKDETLQDKDNILKESVSVINKIKRSNLGIGEVEATLSQDDVNELSQLVNTALNDKVFKEQLNSMPDASVFGRIAVSSDIPIFSEISGIYKERVRAKEIDQIGSQTSSMMVRELLNNNPEGVKEVYKKGIERAIRAKYYYHPEMQGDLIPNETVINIMGKPYTFKGYGAEDILVEAQ